VISIRHVQNKALENILNTREASTKMFCAGTHIAKAARQMLGRCSHFDP